MGVSRSMLSGDCDCFYALLWRSRLVFSIFSVTFAIFDCFFWPFLTSLGAIWGPYWTDFGLFFGQFGWSFCIALRTFRSRSEPFWDILGQFWSLFFWKGWCHFFECFTVILRFVWRVLGRSMQSQAKLCKWMQEADFLPNSTNNVQNCAKRNYETLVLLKNV